MEELTLGAHEDKSQRRYEMLSEKLDATRATHHGETKMEGAVKDDVKIYNTIPGGGHGGNDNMAMLAALLNNRPNNNIDGAGFGGMGGLGGILIGALLGGGGLFGRRDGERGSFTGECASKSDILLTKLGSIEAAIPAAEAQMQLALVGSTATIKDGQNASNLALLAALGNITQTIGNDGDRTRAVVNQQGDRIVALVNDINRENLNRQITELNAALVEARADHRGTLRARDTEVNVTQNVNQAQAQAQQQTQFNDLRECMHRLLTDSQVIRAQNSAINIGGLQSASPTNTNTQVR